MEPTVPPPFRVVIVDDEPVARQRVRRLLAREDGVEIVAECTTGGEAVHAVVKHSPDLLVPAVPLTELDGFGVLAALPPAKMPPVIVVVPHALQALPPSHVHAVPYRP